MPGGIWLHAVSVGEVLSAARLIVALRERYPGRAVCVSCATVAGRELAEAKLAGLADAVFFAPLDFAWAVRRVLRRLRPAMVIVLETEIWPNLWREARRFGAKLYVVNGRISDRAWPRYQRMRWFFQPVLGLPSEIYVQSEQDAARYRHLGAPGAVCLGNLKYDVDPPPPPAAEIVTWAGSSPLWIAASTMPPDEEAQVLNAFRRLSPNVKLLLAPRRPERFALTASLLAESGLSWIRRTELAPAANGDEARAQALTEARVLLLDTIGELAGCFALPSVVFVGGSLVSWGGHNLLEPAVFGRAIVTGPHMQNFASMAAEFCAAGAVREVASAESLAAAIAELLAGDREGLGERAKPLASRHRGLARQIAARLDLGEPLTHPPFRWLLWPLSRVWLLGLTLDRWLTRRRRLSKPVISIGGLAMGGVGKTPVVLRLASRLADEGFRVAILTRGYGRRSRASVILRPGEMADPGATGDEAQLYLRLGRYAVGIGSDRHRNGRLLENGVDVFLLDDGFQHWPLHRDLDILLLDPADPNAGGGLFPLGLLREPRSAADRAGIVLRPDKIVQNNVPPGRYSAFCAIGNPHSFRQTLRTLPGVEIAEFRAFPDHHPIRSGDLAGLPGPLLTTAKDAARLAAGMPAVTVVEIDVAVAGEEEIMRRIRSLLGPDRAG
jgi:3-deoxy-D-manno-octulosonic-acid transferase/tetraacyldisaccharide-1-P 4'-kinase